MTNETTTAEQAMRADEVTHSVEQSPAPATRADVLAVVTDSVRIDSQVKASEYLDESIAPFGGE